jgi:saccharopepsin
MKGSIITAASLLGVASAAIHRMPLKKVPLSEQLETANIDAHVKHLGQKYMGVRPATHADEMFKDTSMHVDKGHNVPVSNFMNAQCR